MIIATGAEYRKPALDNVSTFEGAGVYYGATPMESQLCVGEEVIVVGGGNSAGQAAVFLASVARRVHVLVRGPGLAETMSRYLVRRIEDNPNVVLHTSTEIVALEGNGSLARVRWRDGRTGDVETHDIRHVFLMMGAVPNTRWLNGCLALDDNGFVKTGPDLSSERAGEREVAARPAAVPARNEPAAHLRGWRCTWRKYRAGGVRRRRGVDRGRVRSSSASRVTER